MVAEASEARVTNRELLERAAALPEDEPSAERPRPDAQQAEADGRAATALLAEPAPDDRIVERQWRPTVWFNPWIYQSGEQV